MITRQTFLLNLHLELRSLCGLDKTLFTLWIIKVGIIPLHAIARGHLSIIWSASAFHCTFSSVRIHSLVVEKSLPSDKDSILVALADPTCVTYVVMNRHLDSGTLNLKLIIITI